MTDTPTPGQVAYEAYWHVRTIPTLRVWRDLPHYQQFAWEAAAQAVLAHEHQQEPRIPTLDQVQGRLCRFCGQSKAAHPQEGEAWRCRLSDGPLLPKEGTHAPGHP